jgi:hypothetical protein
MPSATMTLTYDPGGASESVLTIPAPRPGYEVQSIPVQNIGQTAGGTYYVYDTGVHNYRTAMTVEMSATEKANLEAFVKDDTQGMVNTFQWLDHLGTTHSGARFRLAGEGLSFRKTRSGRYEIELSFITNEAVE